MYFNYDGVSVYYNRQGSGAKLLLLHGWGADGRVFAALQNRYKERFDVISADFPPFGLSGTLNKDYTVTDYKNLVLSLLDYLEIEKTDIICHSFGGRVAAKLACGNPQRVNKIIFCASAGIIKRKTPKFYINKILFSAAKLLVKLKFINKTRLKRFYSADYIALPDNMKKTFVNIINEDLTPDIKNIRQPAVLIWGDKDRETPLYMAKLFNRYIKGSRLYVLKGCGHYAFLDRQKPFLYICDNFLYRQTE